MNLDTRDRSSATSAPSGRRLSRRKAVLAGGAAVGAAALGTRAFPGALAQDDAGTLTIPVYPYGQPVTLDPHRAANWGHHWVMLPYVWQGLLGFDEHGAVVPALATSVEPDEAGAVWVAEIRSDATFASGNPVTAEALIQGWLRALDPAQLAPMAGFMSRVQGFDAYVAGESTDIGFEARGATTVAIRLAEPWSLFPEDLATFVWAAVDGAALEGIAPSAAPFADAGAGPWRLVASDAPDIVTMTPHPARSGEVPSGVTSLRWQTLDGPDAIDRSITQLIEGGLAVADVSGANQTRVQEDTALAERLETIERSGSTLLIGMDFSQAPFNDVRVRRALAMAIDRDGWSADIQGGAFTPALAITPPVLAQSANYAAPSMLPFDPDAARTLLSDAGFDPETQPAIVWRLPAEGEVAELDRAEALVQMILDNSGIRIEIDSTRTAEQIDAQRRDEGGLQIEQRWWWPLTASPSGLAQLALPDAPAMQERFNWSTELDDETAAGAAETFTALVTDAGINLDVAQRLQLWAEAERLLLENAVFIPLGHGVQRFLRAENVTGTRHGAFTGYVPVALDTDVQIG